MCDQLSELIVKKEAYKILWCLTLESGPDHLPSRIDHHSHVLDWVCARTSLDVGSSAGMRRAEPIPTLRTGVALINIRILNSLY